MSLWRTRWAAIGAAVAVALGGGGIGLVSAGASSGERPVTITIEPTRILDTRVDLGLTGRFVNETPRDVQVTGNVAIAPTGTATVVPTDAVAVLVNVTVVVPDSNGFLALRPGGAAGRPSTSTVNFAAGSIEPNAATVDLGPGGTVQVFVKTAALAGTADVLLDVVGYTVDHDHDDRYYTEPEVDALVSSIPEGPEGPQGPPGPGAADYQNVIVVAKSGGDFDSVTAAMNAVGADPDYPASSASNRYLVWVAPGVYDDEDIDMQPYVDIEGSGQGVTVLRSVGGTAAISPNSATLVGADNAELRQVTVEIESSNGTNWTHAIYTSTGTSFKNVTAKSTGGSRTRGMFVATGGRVIMIDVILIAEGATVSNLGLDLFEATAFADGLFATASGGDVAIGIYVNSAASEVQFENVTAHARDADAETTGLRSDDSSVTLEGLNIVATSPISATNGLWCQGAGHTMRVLGENIYSATSSASTDDPAYGVFGSGCNLEVRNAVVDAVAAGGWAFGVSHSQSDVALAANFTIDDVEVRAESASFSAAGLDLGSGGGTPAGTYGRVTELNVRANGGSQSTSTYGIRHKATGEVQYRGVTVLAGGSANFMYGIQTDGDGTPRFDDLVIDAIGEVESTVFGVEFLTDSTTMTNARVRAVNLDTGTVHDAVGVKANSANGVTFTDVTAYAEAETNVWGADLINSETRVVRVDARAVSTGSGIAYGTRCAGASSEIHDSVLRSESAGGVSYGLRYSDCSGAAVGSEFAGGTYGLYVFVGTGIIDTNEVRNSHIAGATTVRTLGDANLVVVHSSLNGGVGTSGSGTDVQECTAVTYNSGGAETFQATTADPCP